jgi:hypothetical protein
MSYTADSGRLRILEDMGAAAAELAEALALLGEAYAHLDERAAERLEAVAFRPLQTGYGRLGRASSDFAHRYSLSQPDRTVAAEPAPGDPRRLIERAGEAAGRADQTLAELQDTLLPVEVGDETLRAGLSGVRTLIAPVPDACHGLIRTLGR